MASGCVCAQTAASSGGDAPGRAPRSKVIARAAGSMPPVYDASVVVRKSALGNGPANAAVPGRTAKAVRKSRLPRACRVASNQRQEPANEARMEPGRGRPPKRHGYADSPAGRSGRCQHHPNDAGPTVRRFRGGCAGTSQDEEEDSHLAQWVALPNNSPLCPAIRVRRSIVGQSPRDAPLAAKPPGSARAWLARATLRLCAAHESCGLAFVHDFHHTVAHLAAKVQAQLAALVVDEKPGLRR
jgi:hypothetical protein